jgi:N-acetylmuramoyl-L-alanine amidase
MKRILLILCVISLVLLSGCVEFPPAGTSGSERPTTQGTKPTPIPTEPSNPTVPTDPGKETEPSDPTDPIEETKPTEPATEKKLIVIDAGHQGKSNKDKEPVGPGATELKTKVSSGTSGCVSGYDEHEINLIVALQLQQELLARGYDVLMIRTTADVDISNAQRAQIANDAQADAVIRIHCNASDNESAHGALTICQTKNNPYQPQLYQVNRKLAQCVIDAFVEETDCYDRGVWETDTMTGLNWCEVPNCFIELGFMSNPWEDALMATGDYQALMVQGIANGIDNFFAE